MGRQELIDGLIKQASESHSFALELSAYKNFKYNDDQGFSIKRES